MSTTCFTTFTSNIKNFEAAEAGSLWCFDRPTVPAPPGARIIFHLPEGKSADLFYEYEHKLIDNASIIIKLGDARKTLVGNGLHRGTLMLHKVLANLANGETEIGWISRAAIQGLRIYNG